MSQRSVVKLARNAVRQNWERWRQRVQGAARAAVAEAVRSSTVRRVYLRWSTRELAAAFRQWSGCARRATQVRSQRKVVQGSRRRSIQHITHAASGRGKRLAFHIWRRNVAHVKREADGMAAQLRVMRQAGERWARGHLSGAFTAWRIAAQLRIQQGQEVYRALRALCAVRAVCCARCTARCAHGALCRSTRCHNTRCHSSLCHSSLCHSTLCAGPGAGREGRAVMRCAHS
jgi:hypothetical protein